MTKADPLTGVKCFSIGGRMVERRQRCLGMTDEERRWRAQWLKDQVLSHREPVEVPEYYKSTTHFIRRLWKTPMNNFEKALSSIMSKNAAYVTRKVIGNGVVFFLSMCLITYHLKYHSNNFAKGRSVEVLKTRKPMHPDEPNYPYFYMKKPYEYYDLGFYSSVLCQEVEPLEPPPPPPPPPSSPTEEIICPAKEN